MAKGSWSASQHPPHTLRFPGHTKVSAGQRSHCPAQRALLESEATIWKEASLVEGAISHATDQQVAGLMAALRNGCVVNQQVLAQRLAPVWGGCTVNQPGAAACFRGCSEELFVWWLRGSHGYLGYNRDSLLCPRLMSPPSNSRRPSRSRPWQRSADPSWHRGAGGSERSQRTFLLGGSCVAVKLRS